MYSIDDKDSVIALSEIPSPEAGAPSPVVQASEESVAVAYYTTPADGAVALVSFTMPHVHLFGAPNDEALDSHPLYERGLTFYGAFEVHDSSWIRSLERMNRVHRFHNASRFAAYRHFIITFHDTTFECIAEGFTTSMHKEHPAEVMRLANAPSV
jgi:hypothetical protein